MTTSLINRDRLVNIFLDLARKNTPSRQEKEAADLAKTQLESLGFECFYDDAGIKAGGNVGNLIAFKKGAVPEAPGIFFSAHFDTVEPTPGLEPILDGEIIRSDGTTLVGADDKCGIAPILEAMYVLEEQNIAHGDIQLLLTICEEIGLVGAKHLDPKHIKAQYGYVLDSGPPVGAYVYQAPTQEIYDVLIRGRSSHAGAAPEDGVSAIKIAEQAIAQMKLGRVDPEKTANVGIIQGGNATNIIPAQVFLKCEARSRNVAKLDRQRQHMLDLFNRTAEEFGGTCEIKVERVYDGYELDMDSPVLAIAETATEAIGLEYLLRVTGGGADANYFNKYGVPTTVIGCGMQNIHRHDEFVTIPDMIRSAELVLSIIQTASELRE